MIEHVAIIPDGNRRWAKEHGLPPLEGHRRGAKAMHEVVESLIEKAIPYLTVWGFSIDNWKRSQEEVASLFRLLTRWIDRDTPWLNRRNVRLRYIGRIGSLPHSLQLAINHAVELTKNNTAMTLNLAFNYSGRAEIVDAVRQLVDKVTLAKAIRLIADKEDAPSQKIDEASLSRCLYTDGMPDVNLVIRTAGEFRLSNFLLWQTAYSEFYFTPVLWPDFDTTELERALLSYNERQRHFGGD
ncbi:Ditrans,polycis-undecaprenyl-diphosphate synthase ((2E,6E)-farnesyl-diphosphate specific) [subsurface metagenome]